MSATPRQALTWAISIVLVVALILGAQAVAATSRPSGGFTATGKAVGTAGFDFLAGVRVFAAAVLWNRLDPQFHSYYSNVAFENQIQMLPTLRLIETLNPQFEQSYYEAAYMLSRRGRTAEAVQVAREGVANNPKSGLLRANLVQMLLFEDRQKNLQEALRQARVGIGPDMVFQSPDDEYDAVVSFRLPFQISGDTKTVAALNARLARIRLAHPGQPQEH